MATKKYRGVSRDKNGKIFYQTEFGVDPETGKRRRKKVIKIRTVIRSNLKNKHLMSFVA